MRQPAIPKLSKLRTAERAELLAMWTATIGKPPRFRASRELLASALAWQLQERKFGGLTPATRRRLRVLARARQRKQPARPLPQPPINLRPGTVIIKQWRGAQHVVMVLADGFQHQGRVYGSLSQLAREITGTRWNGPAFFGLRQGQGRTAQVHRHGR
jgi:Protein of unknown function (DUF2924)